VFAGNVALAHCCTTPSPYSEIQFQPVPSLIPTKQFVNAMIVLYKTCIIYVRPFNTFCQKCKPINRRTINTKQVVCDLGVYFDIELSTKQHIVKVATACFYHIRRLRQIRRRVEQTVTMRLVLVMITSRLDYCNSVLAGLPLSTLEPLQKVQNSAACLIFNLRHHDHISPCLITSASSYTI